MTSLFGYPDNGAYGLAYDMMVLDDIKRQREVEEKEAAEEEYEYDRPDLSFLRDIYGRR